MLILKLYSQGVSKKIKAKIGCHLFKLKDKHYFVWKWAMFQGALKFPGVLNVFLGGVLMVAKLGHFFNLKDMFFLVQKWAMFQDTCEPCKLFPNHAICFRSTYGP